jgi:hypothetical protein
MVESLVIPHAAGGDNLEDVTHLREDAGLPEMVGHQIPSPEAARQSLYQCHDDRLDLVVADPFRAGTTRQPDTPASRHASQQTRQPA